jgi:hypothetical protein
MNGREILLLDSDGKILGAVTSLEGVMAVHGIL